ncbi:uncharacterized protein LOC135840676 [Planococcus citri]|uniref:uncharacterized protein LOC135840676 n=1 Tax=Planococcus citri TaxID=170843 RepID=UPI0031F796F7
MGNPHRYTDKRTGSCTYSFNICTYQQLGIRINTEAQLPIEFKYPSNFFQVMDLSEANGRPSGIFIYNVNTFKPFADLRRIIIKHNMQMRNTNPALETINYNMLEQAFQYIETLEYLEFSDSSLKDDYTIHLPKKLKILNVDRNDFKILDAHWCEELEEISANNNRLKNIPKLHFEGPPLKKLLLKGNPMDDMTVLNIAPLCELTVLELEFSGVKSYYNTQASYCNCMMIKQWAKDAKISGPENLKCVELRGSKPTCSEEILEKGRSLRKKCPLLKHKDAVSNKLFNVMKYIFFSILFLVLLAIAILYIIRHFHLREFWAAHHMSPAAPRVKMEEEEEESFKNSDSLSNDSDSNTEG